MARNVKIIIASCLPGSMLTVRPSGRPTGTPNLSDFSVTSKSACDACVGADNIWIYAVDAPGDVQSRGAFAIDQHHFCHDIDPLEFDELKAQHDGNYTWEHASKATTCTTFQMYVQKAQITQRELIYANVKRCEECLSDIGKYWVWSDRFASSMPICLPNNPRQCHDQWGPTFGDEIADEVCSTNDVHSIFFNTLCENEYRPKADMPHSVAEYTGSLSCTHCVETDNQVWRTLSSTSSGTLEEFACTSKEAVKKPDQVDTPRDAFSCSDFGKAYADVAAANTITSVASDKLTKSLVDVCSACVSDKKMGFHYSSRYASQLFKCLALGDTEQIKVWWKLDEINLVPTSVRLILEGDFDESMLPVATKEDDCEGAFRSAVLREHGQIRSAVLREHGQKSKVDNEMKQPTDDPMSLQTKLIIAGIVFAVVLTLGAGIFFFFRNKSATADDDLIPAVDSTPSVAPGSKRPSTSS